MDTTKTWTAEKVWGLALPPCEDFENYGDRVTAVPMAEKWLSRLV